MEESRRSRLPSLINHPFSSSPSSVCGNHQEAAPNKYGRENLHCHEGNPYPSKKRKRYDWMLMMANAADFVEEEDRMQAHEEAREMKKTGIFLRLKTVAAARVDTSYKNKKKKMTTTGDINKREVVCHVPGWVLDKFRLMGAADQQLKVMSKKVTVSDTSKSQNRLLLPRETVTRSAVLEALREDNLGILKSVDGLPVLGVDSEGREFELKLKYLVSNNAYRLIGKWMALVEANNLQYDRHIVHLCIFRVPASGDGKLQLRLGIVKESIPDQDPVTANLPSIGSDDIIAC